MIQHNVNVSDTHCIGRTDMIQLLFMPHSLLTLDVNSIFPTAIRQCLLSQSSIHTGHDNSMWLLLMLFFLYSQKSMPALT